jgi:outer membrane protein OmpA-like peptidoglycan-associated protein
MRIRVSFDPNTEVLDMSSLSTLPKIAHRIKQYASQNITIIGPLDHSSLRGLYASEDERSSARASQVADQLAKAAELPAGSITVQPYAPMVIGAAPSNGVELHLELKQ